MGEYLGFNDAYQRRFNWRVGDGQKNNIYDDPWLADENGRSVTSSQKEELTVVRDLIDNDTKEWNYDLLVSNFDERDVRCILSVPFSSRNQEDKLTWAFSGDGLYSVKTTYMLSQTIFTGSGLTFGAWTQYQRSSTSYGESVQTRWPRMQVHLRSRHMQDTNVCPWCVSSPETLHHAFFNCPAVHDLWRECDCLALLDFDPSDDFKETLMKWRRMDAKKCVIGVALMWHIWNKKNDKIFKEK
ncbi:uncharacterized protein LOC110717211 [Chenopodium quinoa]|uniref:uncharacterized protein LOC110717211 n=1 Tax=Chenopodium quinoa TaxID=63459 RepID=UPI000B76BF25|nr:uncharacterized protein LOC110717211 [Chenopodium quinoa]